MKKRGEDSGGHTKAHTGHERGGRSGIGLRGGGGGELSIVNPLPAAGDRWGAHGSGGCAPAPSQLGLAAFLASALFAQDLHLPAASGRVCPPRSRRYPASPTNVMEFASQNNADPLPAAPLSTAPHLSCTCLRALPITRGIGALLWVLEKSCRRSRR